MTTLHDRLTDLAGEAPPGGAVPGLWDRARRAHRRRRIGTVAIVVVVLLGLGAIATLDWSRARQALAPADSAPALPQKIWMPSPWLPGTDDGGPLGQLAAIQTATRASWSGTREGVAGVSAGTGEYRFLDLPGAVLPGDRLALSPDGRHVAYWFSGETRETPETESGSVVGVAVYDTSSGEVVRHTVPTDHGLMPGDLWWSDSRRVIFDYSQIRAGDDGDEMLQHSGAPGDGLLVWDTAGDSEPVPLGVNANASVEASSGRGLVLLERNGVIAFAVERGARVSAPTHLRPGISTRFASAIDDDGSQVAWIGGNRSPNVIRTADLVGRAAPARVVPDSDETFAVAAWLDDDHVAAVRRIGSGYSGAALFDVDVQTGDSTVILHYPDGTWGSTAQLATDLLASPAVPRDAPPRPLDPRWVAGAEVAVVILGVGALLLWRRRHVRP